MEKSMKKIKLHKIILSLFLCLAAFCFVSCDMINTPVKEFFTDGLNALNSRENSSDSENSDNSTTPATDSDTDDNPSEDSGDSGEDTSSGSEDPVTPSAPENTSGPVTPDPAEFDSIDTDVSLVFYVSSDGNDDENDGSKDSPFKTIGKALSNLKAAFSADIAKTKGYVLLLSDIEISEEISLETYRFDDLSPNIVELTIAGCGAFRTIDAKSACRVMKVGYTNGAITLKNLKIKGGYSTDVGGAGLYVSSQGLGTLTFFTIDNCIFTENTSSYSGAAIALQTDYSVYINNSEISSNTGSDGASALDIERTYNGSTYVIYNTVITDNTTTATYDPSNLSPVYDYGYVINTDGLAALAITNNTVIKNNSISQVSSASGADYSKLCAVKKLSSLSGAVTIKQNNVYLDDGTELIRNIVIDTAAGDKILIGLDCTGSSIGVKPAASITSEAVFTTNYASRTSALPASVFVSDCEYGIGYDSTGAEAAFVVNSGSFTNPFDITMSFSTSQKVIASGKAAGITVTPLVKDSGTDITASVADDITWNLSFVTGSTTVAASTTNVLSLTSAQTLPDTYTLYITATLNSITYDDTVQIACKDTLDGFVSVTGAIVSGAVADSGVFVTGRSVAIPSLYAGEHELTQKEYLEYCYYAHSSPASGYTGDNYPACLVSWYDAIVYCNLRSIAEGLTPAYSLSGETDPTKWDGIVTGSGTYAGKYCGPLNNTAAWNEITFDTSANGWRMPTEAEWEYLARGADVSSTQTTYAGSDTCSDVAWTASNATDPQLVKQKLPNTLGLYDMSGNVFEYMWDWYSENESITSSTPATGVTSPDTYSEGGNRRFVRGGGYTYGEAAARISDRSIANKPEMRWANCGVRIVRNVN